MIPDKFLEVLRHEGVVAIVSQGETPHVVNTWNSYLCVTEDEKLLIPAGSMKVTETNILLNPQVQLTLGSREVEGFHSLGTGFLVRGTATFLDEGENFQTMKARFPWMRAVLQVTVRDITQTLSSDRSPSR